MDAVTGNDQLADVSEDTLGTGGGTGSGSASTSEAPVERTDAGRSRWGVFIGIAATVVLLDQLSKAWLVANVAPGEVISIVGDYLRLVQHHNSGALFGLFRDQAILFGLVSLGVIALIVVYESRAGRTVYLSVALGLLLGGAVGNVIDRLRLGYVVDWVDIGLGSIRFWTFNVADSAVSLAIVMLVALALFPALAGRTGGRSDVTARPGDGSGV